MKTIDVGELVVVRPTTNSLWASQAATVVAVKPEEKLYRLRFKDGAELWYGRKEITWA